MSFCHWTEGGRRWATSMVNHLPPLGPGQNIYPLPPRDQVRTSTPSPPLGPGQNIYPLPPPPGPGHNTSLPPPLDNSTYPLPSPPLWTTAPTPPPPLWTTAPTLPPLDNSTYPPPLDNSTYPPSPPLRSMGGRYASYWNAFLLNLYPLYRPLQSHIWDHRAIISAGLLDTLTLHFFVTDREAKVMFLLVFVCSQGSVLQHAPRRGCIPVSTWVGVV